jgi:N-glycosylase/DNA lyase
LAELVAPANSAVLSGSRGVDLESTVHGGQAFRWYTSDAEQGVYRGVVGDRAYLLSAGDIGISVECLNGPLDGAEIERLQSYLGLDGSFEGFSSRYADDPVIGPALESWPGLRLLRQDPWECLVGFITSATSNVPRIKLNVGSIAVELGSRVGPGERDFAFPIPERLAEAGEARIRELGLGFRAPYIVDAAQRVASGSLNLENLRTTDYMNARGALTDIHGIGEKIADCVLAFSLDKGVAFPVDRWVKRALAEWYGMPERMNNSAAGEWARDRFGEDGAYVQQYLFHRQRMAGRGHETGATR